MPKITFYPLGNADCILIDLQSEEKVLFDYAHTRDPDDADDLRCDLPTELRSTLGDRDYFDVVAFTHLDKDHYTGATEFFYFEHIKKYQGDVDGKPRIKMTTMWVPAAVITEKLSADDDPEAKAIQKEARERFKAGKDIRIFSRPERLREWCEENSIDFDDVKRLVTNAGTLTPEFTLEEDGAEFFVHSPFAKRLDEETVEDRNEDSLLFHATFLCGDTETKAIFAADAPHDALADIVNITESKGNRERLEWHVIKLPHHCSYLSLGPEKGDDKTEPVEEVKRLYEKYGQDAGIIVSTSNPIPEKGTDDEKADDPPHRQAANYYRDAAREHKGTFKVTMEHPDSSSPQPLHIQICSGGHSLLAADGSRASQKFTRITPRQKPRGYA